MNALHRFTPIRSRLAALRYGTAAERVPEWTKRLASHPCNRAYLRERTPTTAREVVVAHMPEGQDKATWLAYWGIDERRVLR